MKKTILTLLVFMSAATTLLYAQRGRPGGFDPKEMALREKENVLKKVDSLSDTQVMLIDGIYEEFSETVTETFEEIRRTRNYREMRTKMAELRDEKNLLIKDVLNKSQYLVYLDIVEENRPAQRNQGDRQENTQQRPESNQPRTENNQVNE